VKAAQRRDKTPLSPVPLLLLGIYSPSFTVAAALTQSLMS
jgi:hypothetical protein